MRTPSTTDIVKHIKKHYPTLVKAENKQKALLKIRAYMLSESDATPTQIERWLNDKVKLSIINVFVHDYYSQLIKTP